MVLWFIIRRRRRKKEIEEKEVERKSRKEGRVKNTRKQNHNTIFVSENLDRQGVELYMVPMVLKRTIYQLSCAGGSDNFM